MLLYGQKALRTESGNRRAGFGIPETLSSHGNSWAIAAQVAFFVKEVSLNDEAT